MEQCITVRYGNDRLELSTGRYSVHTQTVTLLFFMLIGEYNRQCLLCPMSV